MEDSFIEAITKSFEAYNGFGARSNKKLIPIHLWFAERIEKELGEGYEISSLGKGREEIAIGKYYPKSLDICVKFKNEIISTISFKFVTSNYKQNANNYFENLLGETANIRRANIGFAHFLLLRGHTPYYDKNKGNLRGVVKKIEIINDKDLSKYISLFKDTDFPHKPDVLGIEIIEIDKSGKPIKANLNELGISKANIDFLEEQFVLDKFIKRFVALCKLKS
ncbi:MAG: hypothetical protein ACOX1V_01995 [Candidatus Iainarchaeum sp.]